MSVITRGARERSHELQPKPEQEFIDLMRNKLAEQGMTIACAMEIMLRKEHQTQIGSRIMQVDRLAPTPIYWRQTLREGFTPNNRRSALRGVSSIYRPSALKLQPRG